MTMIMAMMSTRIYMVFKKWIKIKKLFVLTNYYLDLLEYCNKKIAKMNLVMEKIHEESS